MGLVNCPMDNPAHFYEHKRPIADFYPIQTLRPFLPSRGQAKKLIGASDFIQGLLR